MFIILFQIGSQGGTVISLPLSGLLADNVSWESVFYVFGTLGCVWFVAWCFLVYDSPDTHPRISEVERAYIVSHIPTSNKGSKLPFPPLLKIATSVPFLALLCAHIGQNWGYYTLLTETPTYLNNIQHFSLTAVNKSPTRTVLFALLTVNILEWFFVGTPLLGRMDYGPYHGELVRLLHLHWKA